MNVLDIFTGGAVKAIENIATEWIDTDKESAEAKALMVKTLDPNGAMRRQISITVSGLYVMYVLIMFILIMMQSFNIGDTVGVKTAIGHIAELFIPITSTFTLIASASFGVNYQNSKKGV